MITRPAFYNYVRAELFDGKLTPGQVEGMEALLNEWERRGFTDKRWLAYILATVYHETGKRMHPVKELGGERYLKSKKYYPYYGRDLVQTTWRYNYEKVRDFTGVDVVSNPDLIADLTVAAKTAIEFMYRGHYTGRRLGQYFDHDTEDWINARRIINGTDKAALIAGYGKEFMKGLQS